jgi:transcription elongation factor S-II
MAEMRSLYLNLKDKQNPALRNEIVLGYISTEKVANMSKEVGADTNDPHPASR